MAVLISPPEQARPTENASYMPSMNNACSGFVQLWFAAVTASTQAREDAVQAWLSASEREYLLKIKHVARRREYLLSRALMRHALSRNFDRPESEWKIADRVRAKPVVADLPADAYFGLSHSRGAICFALSKPVK